VDEADRTDAESEPSRLEAGSGERVRCKDGAGDGIGEAVVLRGAASATARCSIGRVC
jgi:hypothetical protein